MLAHPTQGWQAGRVVIVTGGSRGTGRAVALALARAGDAVVVDYAHDQRAADGVVDEILRAGGTAMAVRADVGDALDVARLFAETAEGFGGVDLVVHAAGPPSALVRQEAGPAAMLSFAGCWRADIPADVAALVSWLVGRRPSHEMFVVLPVSDVDRAKRFYRDLGWQLDADMVRGEGFRVVRLTPPGAQASIIFGTGVTSCEPGSVEGLILSVGDVAAARASLIARGADVRAVFTGDSHAAWISFTDPDGNGWLLEETDRPAGGVPRDGP